MEKSIREWEELADAAEAVPPAARRYINAVAYEQETLASPTATDADRERATSQRVQARDELQRLVDELYERERYRGQHLPGAGHDAGFSDPRCEAREQAAAQGRLFMDPDFCRGDDMLTCLLRSQDTLYDLTGGRCRQEVGPDDRQRPVCERRDSERSREGGRGDMTPNWGGGRLDDDRIGVGSQRRIGREYVDTTPLGTFLATLCARGGCPEDF
jgi:hypothetical protein